MNRQEEINSKVIREILSKYNIREQWKGEKKNIYYECPMHEDIEASLVISKSNKKWYCYSDKCDLTNHKIYRPFEDLVKLLEELKLKK